MIFNSLISKMLHVANFEPSSHNQSAGCPIFHFAYVRISVIFAYIPTTSHGCSTEQFLLCFSCEAFAAA